MEPPDDWKKQVEKQVENMMKGEYKSSASGALMGPGLFMCPAKCGVADVIMIHEGRLAVCPKCGTHLKAFVVR